MILDFLEQIITRPDGRLADRLAAMQLVGAVIPGFAPAAEAIRIANSAAMDPQNPDALLSAAGRVRARLDITSGRDLTMDDLSLASFTGEAGLAYDEYIAEHLRSAGN